MFTFLLLQILFTHAEPTCSVKDVIINNGVDFCATFTDGKKVCASGHTHLLPATGASLRMAVTRMATGQDVNNNRAKILKMLNSTEANTVYQHYTNQFAHLIAEHFSKNQSIELYGEGDRTQFAIYGAVEKKLAKLKGKFDDREYKKLRLILLGPAFESHQQFPKRYSKGIPSEGSDKYMGCDDRSVKKCLTARDAPMAERVFRCQKKNCYWFGGGAHVAGMKKWFEKQCQVSGFAELKGNRKKKSVR